MASGNSNNSDNSGLFAQLLSLIKDPMGIALVAAGLLAIAVVLYVVVL